MLSKVVKYLLYKPLEENNHSAAAGRREEIITLGSFPPYNVFVRDSTHKITPINNDQV